MSALRHDRRGLVSLEFALCVPVLLALGIGCFEVGFLLRADGKLRTTGQAVAELVASQSQASSATLTDICRAAQMIMMPFAGNRLSITVASVTNQPGSGVITDWQDTSCGSGNPIADPVAAAAAFVPNGNDSVILVAAAYDYQSPLPYILKADWQLTQTAFARPYENRTVTGP